MSLRAPGDYQSEKRRQILKESRDGRRVYPHKGLLALKNICLTPVSQVNSQTITLVTTLRNLTVIANRHLLI